MSTDFGTADLLSLYAAHVDTKRLAIAFLTWAVYDFAITIDDSIELFWKYRWSWGKIMFLVNRYNTIFILSIIVALLSTPTPSATYCMVIPWIELVSSIVLITLVDLAMIIRVYALWNRNKWILISVLLLCGVQVVSYIALIAYSYNKGSLTPQALPFTGCLIDFGYDKAWIVFITSLVFEITIISLTIYKSQSVALQRGLRTPLFTMLFEDGVGYFSIITLSHIVGLVLMVVQSVRTIPILGSYPSLSIAGVACNRLFIRLQGLLLGKRSGHTRVTSAGTWSSAVPEFALAHCPTDNELGATCLSPQAQARMNRTRHQPSSIDFKSDIGMMPMDYRTTEQSATRVPGVALSGSFQSASSKGALDSSTWLTKDFPNAPRNGEIGGFIVSRVGRYD